VYNTNKIQQSLERIFSALEDRESDFRGYMLTGDTTYWHRKIKRDEVEINLNRIDSLLTDNPIQKRNFLKLKELINASIQKQELIATRLKDPAYLKSQSFYSDLKAASQRLDSIKIRIVKMQNIASSLSENHSLAAQKHTVIATIVGVAVSLFSMIIFIIAFYFIDQELKRSKNYLNETQSLNTRIAEINSELEKANSSLHQLNFELEGKNFQLEKYAKELSSFTHITSHDMQEPLRKIEFYISIVEDREKQNLTDEGRKFLEKIKQSVSRMRQLFLSMLDFSLTNTTDNNIEDVDLNEVLQETVSSLKVYIKDTNTILEVDQLPRVKGIKYQLIQLFENIISNAIKFRRNDVIAEIQITQEIIHTDHRTVPGLKNNTKYYRIDFIDNGVGFDSKYAEKIFEIFHRLITKSDSYGVGIGLAICRKIAENHGGILIAKSQPDIGSIFSLYIPVNS
jgi:signal transduction histidine kinase